MTCVVLAVVCWLLFLTSAQADITSNLVLYYDFNEGTGTTATDRSGNGLNGTLATTPATPTWITTPCVASHPHLRGCLSFDGADWIQRLNHALLNITGDITLAAWASSNTSAVQLIFGFYNSATPFQGYGMRFSNTDTNFGFWDSSNWTTSTGINVRDGVMRHLVVSVAGTTASFYVNGVPRGTQTVGARASNTDQRAIGSGENGCCLFLTGQIDEPRIYSRALSASDVLELYMVGLAGSRAPIVSD